MARIRYIKPGFFEDTKLAEASIYARMLYIGLWCWMDKQGIAEDEPKLIKRNIFPYDDPITLKKINTLITELVSLKCLTRVSHGGRNYLFCPKFSTHQKFHPGEPLKYLIPNEVLLASVETPTSNLQNTDKQPADNPLTLTLTGTLTGTGAGTQTPASRLPTLALLWNELSSEKLPKIQGCGKTRKLHADQRWSEYPMEEYWSGIIEKINLSPFCTGTNDRGWKADFDFLIKPETHLRVLEGKYDDQKALETKRERDDWLRSHGEAVP